MKMSDKKKIVVIGNPIEHSLSPNMHNAAFEELNISNEFIYDKLRVKNEDLKEFVNKIRTREIFGANITIPHKVAIIPFMDELTKEANLIGAVNTVFFKDNKVFGHNTDGLGCLNTLKENDVNIKNKKIILIGAGGASRSIAFISALNGASEIIIIDLIEDAAKNLANDVMNKTGIKTKYDSSKNARKHIKDIDIMIHCTPLGMKGENENKSVFVANDFLKEIIVMDIVYNPQMTKLLIEAKNAGCKIVKGLGMLAHQGCVGFELWTGKKAPVNIMINALKGELIKNE